MTINDQLNQIADIIDGSAWGLDKGKPRIYMPGRRDIKIYFEFPDAAYTTPDDQADGVSCLGGASLKVFINDCGQHANWYAGQKRQVLVRHYRHALAVMAITDLGDLDLARKIMDLDDVTSDQVNEFSGHAINGRAPEARAVFGL